ncbi:MAG TPA: hypothetical protein VG347_05160 [Verrucomicrobiae bacterium]|nr:hypothetical protein [Verrucomicrobiae bacterium]
MITNEQCYLFLMRLDNDQRSKNPIVLDEFETGFFASWMEAGQPTNWFSKGRIAVIDRMWRRYCVDLDFKHPLQVVTERQPVPDADPDCCQYIMREDGKQQRCNEPATCREVNRLRYCEAHGAHVKRFNKGIGLVKYP